MNNSSVTIAVIGGGPAGLMAAELLSGAGLAVTVYDRMPSVGRKLLMAGRGGLNLTHSEDLETFLGRYGRAPPQLEAAIRAFPPTALTAWCEGLGQATFVGSSGRVFPKSLKASPLLRAWLARLAGQGVQFRTRCGWQGWTAEGALSFCRADGEMETASPAATILALGGASWPRLGSNGAWVALLAGQGVAISPLRPANCGFAVTWSELFRQRFAGQPLKTIALSFGRRRVRGEAMVTAGGLEGGAVYALSAPLREAIAADGQAVLAIDLQPERSTAELVQRLARPRCRQSLSTFLKKALGLSPLAINLLREAAPPPDDPEALAGLIKAVPIRLSAPASLDRAISTAGGVAFDQLDAHFMLRARPGLFVAGEMLDWEAPTGGYLLQACFATGRAAAAGVLAWLAAG